MRRFKNRFFLSAVLLMVVAFSSVLAFKPKKTVETNRKEAYATKRDLVQQITVAGTVFPNRRTIISPPYNGYVKKIHVHMGQVIKAGDPVVSLAQSLQEMKEPAYPMRAPFPGVVVQIERTEGEYVEMSKEGNALVRIDDLSRLFVRAEVPETYVPKIKKGQEVIIKINGLPNKQYKGQIKTIALAAKEKQNWGRTGDRVDFDVEVEILDTDALVLPGMSTIIDIIIEKKNGVLSLPLEFVQKKDNAYFVTLDKNVERKVEVGLQNEEHFEILSGVDESERVHMVDFYSLPPGQL